MSHTPPIVPPRGPFPTEIMVVGEAPGKNEEAYRQTFIGESGQELMRMLTEAGIHPAACYFTNVFKIRPENNNVEFFFGPKREGAPGLTPLGSGKYLPPSHLFWLSLLQDEIRLVSPRIILALGNTALWALTGKSGITKLRGAIYETGGGIPVLPTYHPAMVLRTWSARSVTVADMAKAKRLLDGDIEKPSFDGYELFLSPTIEDLHKFRILVKSHPDLSIDIETAKGQITMIGFAVTEKCGFCIPFFDPETMENYWKTPEEEVEAWLFCRWALAQVKRKTGQNFTYDTQYLVKSPARTPLLFAGGFDDTILINHALQPEMKKDLGGQVATHLNVPAWKDMRKHKGDEVVKKDE